METDPSTSRPPGGRGQFTLQSLFLLFVALQVLLGLTAFLKQIGFVLSGFAIAAGLGWWLTKPRLMASALTGLLVFVTTYLAVWVGIGYQSAMHYGESRYARRDLIEIEKPLAAYAEETGKLPDSLGDLANVEGYSFQTDENGIALDPWGRPFHYKKTSDGFELATLGRDGTHGGAGLDADIHLSEERNLPESRLPPWQYLFETRGSGALFFVAMLASYCAACTWCVSHPAFDGNRQSVIIGVLATTVSAAVVAFFLASFHIPASQSGH